MCCLLKTLTVVVIIDFFSSHQGQVHYISDVKVKDPVTRTTLAVAAFRGLIKELMSNTQSISDIYFKPLGLSRAS
jgi:hypothetical protein